jgi:ABC-type antimicrobial peptide transport system permease subunit
MIDFIYRNLNLKLYKKQKMQWFILAFGFSLFCALFNLSIIISGKIFEIKPVWVKNDSEFATFGLKSHDGRMIPTTISNIESLKRSKGVNDVAYWGAQQTKIIIDTAESDATIIYISPNFTSLLEVESLPNFNKSESSSVWISERFWRESFNGSNVIGRVIYLTESRVPAVIKGVLPVEWNKIGIHQPSIMTTSDDLEKYINITLGDEQVPDEFVEQAKKQLSIQLPAFYGFASLTKGFDINDLNLKMDAVFTDSNIRLWDGTENLSVFAMRGINFSPEAKNVLKQQWFLVLWLTLVFGLTNILSLLTFKFNETIHRSSEFSIRFAVGARVSHLLKQICSEHFIFLFAVIVFTCLISNLLITQLVANNSDILSVHSISLGWNFSISILFIVAVILVFSSLPLFFACKHNLFIKAKSDVQSKRQSVLAKFNISMQLFQVITALIFCVVMVNFHLNVLDLSNKYNSFYGQHIGLNQQGKFSPANTRDWFAKIESDDISVSSQSFIQPLSPAINFTSKTPDNPNYSVLNIMNVNNNFLELFANNYFLGEGVDEQGVVLNVSAAKMLGYPSPKDALGARLFSDDPFLLGFKPDEHIKVNGVIEDLPHFGIVSKNIPFVYADIGLLQQLQKFYVYYDTSNIETAERVTKEFVNKSSNWETVSKNNIQGELESQNKAIKFLIYFCLSLCVLTSLLSIVGSQNQFRLYVNQKRINFAIHLAMGAKVNDLMLIIFKDFIGAVFFSFIAFALFFSLFLNEMLDKFSIGVNVNAIMASVLVIVSMLVLYTIVITSWSLTRVNINEIFRGCD